MKSLTDIERLNEISISQLGKELLGKTTIIQFNVANNGNLWHPTMNLRWAKTKLFNNKFTTVLQQEFINENGKTEWRDIPIVIL